MKILRAIKPNAGIRVKYRRRLEAMIDDMNRSVTYWIEAAYHHEEERIVGDASPVHVILQRFNRDARRWLKKWDMLAAWLAKNFIGQVSRKATSSLEQAYKEAGLQSISNHLAISIPLQRRLFHGMLDLSSPYLVNTWKMYAVL